MDDKRLQNILRHISSVQQDTLILGNKLIEAGEEAVGRQLIANGLIHDNSKLSGIEWLYLHEGVEPEKFQLALTQHQTTNPHHPEFHPGGIKEMPRVYVAEMVCDWHTRASEFGSDLREWIKDKAVKKFHFSTSCHIYKEVKDLVDLLLEKRFA
jgi:hypothetical protein